MQKRKAALALSAGVMGISTAAIGAIPTEPANVAGQVDNPLVRLPASGLRASEELKRALVQEEGVRDTVYRDVAGYATVGCGHLVAPADGLRVGDRVSYEKILDFLERDLLEAQATVVQKVGSLPLYQHEFDALVDLVYNVGPGALTAKKSPRLVEAIAAGDYNAIAAELQYRYAGGQMARGLAFRSDRRTRMFMNASYGGPRSAGSVAVASLAGSPVPAEGSLPATALAGTPRVQGTMAVARS
jgi:lysozyme